MKTIGFSRRIYKLDFQLTAQFSFQTSNVFSISNDEYKKMFPFKNEPPLVVHGIQLPAEKEIESEFGFLVIDSTCELEEYDSVGEVSANIRPQLLVVYGIISFLTGNAFTPFQSFSQHNTVLAAHLKPFKKHLLSYQETDLGPDLKKIIGAINAADNEKRNLIFTLLERWRKALFLEEDTEESLLYLDESTLAYFHVLELLSKEFTDELKDTLKIKKSELHDQIVKFVQETKQDEAYKLTELLNKYAQLNISVSDQIMQMLKAFKLDCLKSEAIVRRFTKHRNSIAHQRNDIYKEKLIYPLPPFLTSIKNVDENIEVIKVLSARCIACYLGLDNWANEWEFVLSMELPPLSLVKDFIKDDVYKRLSTSEFFQGKINDITPGTLAFSFIKGDIMYGELENCLSKVFKEAKVTKEIAQNLFIPAISLADSNIPHIANKAQVIIEKVDKNKWGEYSNIRDVIKYHEFHGKKVTWFKNYLIKRSQKL
jgi:hypothetical protein